MRPAGLSLHLRISQNVCRQCSRRLVRQSERPFSRAASPRAAVSAVTTPSPRLKAGYFLSNGLLDRFSASTREVSSQKSVATSPTTAATAISTSHGELAPSAASTSTPTPPNAELLPHRRRQAARRAAREAEAAAAAAADGSEGDGTSSASVSDASILPQNSSTTLTNVAAAHPANSIRRHLSALLSLSKPRLTVLVVLTAMAPYALYPVPSFLSPTAAIADAPSLSPLTLLFLTTGTTLCSASANALNMLYEPDTDSLMSRTRNRPLVRAIITRRAALLFAIIAGATGTAALYLGVNPTVAFLGAANIALYAGVYTPMKRLSWLNTWVGALVGGIPPLMGWAAAAGESATGDGSFRELLFASDGSSAGGWLLAGLLFAWQFPHFMALSWGVREEYKAAGLRMLCWVNPARNARVALRYSLVYVPLCVGLCAAGVTEWTFAATSLPVNLWLVREAVRFWRLEGARGSARGLFWASVWHLPVVMVLALLQKKGMWTRVWRSVVGAPEEEDEEWEDDDDEGVDGVDVIPTPLPASTKV